MVQFSFSSFLFVIDMILINTFVAVIYASYAKVKEEIKNTNEKWSMRRVFSFVAIGLKNI